MLVAYLSRVETRWSALTFPRAGACRRRRIWFDLLSPTAEEDRAVEAVLGVSIPSREEMAEIEPSSRLYVENGARFMTASLHLRVRHRPARTRHPSRSFCRRASSSPCVTRSRGRSSRLSQKITRACPPTITGEGVLIDLLDNIIDRAADVLERDSAEIEIVSRRIFGHGRGRKPPSESYQDILRAIGRKADLTSKVRESLVSIGRLVLFLANEADVIKLPKEQRAQVKSMARDATSLTDHATFLANKIQFMLDAVLGLVQLDQNNVIKIFSVVAVVLLPPTMIASIYGMNFKHMPELEWTFGYPLALLLMLASAVLPYAYFKWKRWL